MVFKISSASKSDLGLKRTVNEDSYYADETVGLFMVLDGIGGHKAGEVASKMGLETIREHVIRSMKNKSVIVLGDQYEDLSREAAILNNGIVLANRVIHDFAHSDEEHYGMGTTVVSLLIGEKTVAIGHVGDSRIYLIRDNTIERLTEDHSLVMEQLRRGIIDEEGARKSDVKNIITRALGAEEDVYPEIDELVPCNNDIFLLCSDGLTDLVADEEILGVVQENRDALEHVCHKLIDKANALGGKDNITTVLVHLTKRPAKIFQACVHLRKWLQKVFTGNG